MEGTEQSILVRFICCSHAFKPGDHLHFDAEGMTVCPAHGMRRYGWRSLPVKPVRVIPHDPANPKFINKPDYAYEGEGGYLRVDKTYVDELLSWGLLMPDAAPAPLPAEIAAELEESHR